MIDVIGLLVGTFLRLFCVRRSLLLENLALMRWRTAFSFCLSRNMKIGLNYETPAWRVDRVLADIPPHRRGGGLPPGPTQTVVIGPNTPWAVQMDLGITPYGFLREAANSSATVASKSMGGKKYTIKGYLILKPHFIESE